MSAEPGIYEDYAGLRAISPAKVRKIVEENERLRAALCELVRLKDLHDACEDQTYWATRAVSDTSLAQLRAWEADYAENKPRAWTAAREALSESSGQPQSREQT